MNGIASEGGERDWESQIPFNLNFYLLSWLLFVCPSSVNLTQTRVTQEEGRSVEELLLLDWPVPMFLDLWWL